MQPVAAAGLVVELRGNVQALGLGEGVTGTKLSFLVSVFNERKFAPVNFHPCRLHVSDGFQHILVLFTGHLGDFEGRHVLVVVYVVLIVDYDCCIHFFGLFREKKVGIFAHLPGNILLTSTQHPLPFQRGFKLLV